MVMSPSFRKIAPGDFRISACNGVPPSRLVFVLLLSARCRLRPTRYHFLFYELKLPLNGTADKRELKSNYLRAVLNRELDRWGLLHHKHLWVLC